MSATGAHYREVHRLVESVVTEVVWETDLLSDSVEFVDYLALELINISELPTWRDLALNHRDLRIYGSLHPDLHLCSFFVLLGLSLRLVARILLSFHLGLFNLEEGDLPLMACRGRACMRGQHRLLRDSDCGIGDDVRGSGALNSLGDDHALDLLIGVGNIDVAFRRQEGLKIVDRRRILVFTQHGELGQHSHRELELSCEPGQVALEGLLGVVARL